MADSEKPVPPVPNQQELVEKLTGSTKVSIPWMQWFVQLRDKVNIINASLVNLAGVTGTGFLAKGGVSWVVRTIRGTAGNISVTNGDGFSGDPVIDLVDVIVTSGGILQKYGFDAKGRRDKNAAATTSDLPEGTKLYFTVARVLATVLAGLSTASATVITAADTVLGALGKLQAQVTTNLATLTGHTGNVANPHAVTKAQVGLGNVDNTSDASKPVSTAQQAAIDGKVVQTITNGDTTHAPSGDSVFDALALKAWIPAGYIDGLQMQWISGTALTVSSGSAYIEASANIVPSPSAIAKSSLSLSASTWYHVYLYLNSGTPDIEIVTTVPVVYNGTAYSKTGDASRRYIGSIKTLPTAAIMQFVHNMGNRVTYYENNGAPPLMLLAGGTAIVATTIAAAGAIPTTARVATGFVENTATNTFLIVGNSVGDLTAGEWQGLAYANSALQEDLVPDASQDFTYQYAGGAPSSGGAFVRIVGYQYER